MKKINFDEANDVNGAGSDIKLKPVANTEAPTTGDAPFVPDKHGYKKMMFQKILYIQGA